MYVVNGLFNYIFFVIGQRRTSWTSKTTWTTYRSEDRSGGDWIIKKVLKLCFNTFTQSG